MWVLFIYFNAKFEIITCNYFSDASSFVLAEISQMLNYRVRVRVMVLNATFNNISIISWSSVLLVDETGVPRDNHRPAAKC
jgi:hypothetical protein